VDSPRFPDALLLGAVDSGLLDRLDDNADAAAFKVGDRLVELHDVPVNHSSNRWLS